MAFHFPLLFTTLLLSSTALAQGGSWLPHTNEQRGITDYFGCTTAFVGDVDLDGYSDFLVGAEFADSGNGEAYLYSGSDGSLIRQHLNVGLWSFGRAVCAAGDIDVDGVPDYAVTDFANVNAYSGATGSLLWSWSYDHLEFGHVMVGEEDLTGDGIPDLLSSDTDAGEYIVFSGANGSDCFGLTTFAPSFGHTLDYLSDINGDGIADILIGAPDIGSGSQRGKVYVYAGGPAPGAQLYNLSNPGATNTWNVGEVVKRVADIDGDGIDDFAVLNHEHISGIPGPGRLDFHSGVNGDVIHEVHPPLGWSWSSTVSMTTYLTATGERSGDVVLTMFSLGTDNPKLVRVGPGTNFLIQEIPLNGTPALQSAQLSMGMHPITGAAALAIGEPVDSMHSTYKRDTWLTLSTWPELSVSGGAYISFTINFPNDAAYYDYQVLASATGCDRTRLPGGVDVNLSLDTFLAETFLGQYPAVVQNPMGRLNDYANGFFTLDLPANALNPSLIGSSFYVAAVCYPAPFQFTHATETLALKVIL